MNPIAFRPRFAMLALTLTVGACVPSADTNDDGAGETGDGDGDPIDTSAYAGRIAFTSLTGSALWVRDLASNELLYTAESEGDFPTLILLQDPVLSPDGGVLAYWRLGAIDGVLAGSAGQVVRVDLASGVETRIPSDLGNDVVRLSYIPWANSDGSLVAYREVIVEGFSDPTSATSTTGIALWDGTTSTTLFTSDTLQATKLVLTADASEILFSVTDSNNDFELYRLPVAGGDPSLVALDSHPDLASLEHVNGFGWDASDDGSVIAFAGGIADGAPGAGRVGAFVYRDGTVTRMGEITGILQVDVSGDGDTLTAYRLDGDTASKTVHVTDTAAPEPTVVFEAIPTASETLTFAALNQDGSALAYGGGPYDESRLEIAGVDGTGQTLVISSEIDDRFIHNSLVLSVSLR